MTKIATTSLAVFLMCISILFLIRPNSNGITAIEEGNPKEF